MDYTGAERIYRDALRIDPGNRVTRFNLATTLLMLGNYDEGFDLYESRFEAFQGTFPRSSELDEKIASRPRWRGEALGGKRLLVWAEQGLGDCIMMLRYLSELPGRGVKVQSSSATRRSSGLSAKCRLSSRFSRRIGFAIYRSSVRIAR